MGKNLTILLLATLGLAACNAPGSHNDVWDQYEVRHPLPAGSQVPDSYARQYDGMVDNDSYYVPPECATVFSKPACLN